MTRQHTVCDTQYAFALDVSVCVMQGLLRTHAPTASPSPHPLCPPPCRWSLPSDAQLSLSRQLVAQCLVEPAVRARDLAAAGDLSSAAAKLALHAELARVRGAREGGRVCCGAGGGGQACMPTCHGGRCARFGCICRLCERATHAGCAT